jgi:hypothetical protein
MWDDIRTWSVRVIDESTIDFFVLLNFHGFCMLKMNDWTCRYFHWILVIDDDRFFCNIYLIIGCIFVVLMLFVVVIDGIERCGQLCQTKKTSLQCTFKINKGNKQFIDNRHLCCRLAYFLVQQSNVDELRVSRRCSSIRNASTPVRRSSLDIRIQMEIREKRLSINQLKSSVIHETWRTLFHISSID